MEIQRVPADDDDGDDGINSLSVRATCAIQRVPAMHNVKTTQTYFRVDGSIFGVAVDAGKAERHIQK